MVVMHVETRKAFEIFGVGRRQERALVMVKPPGDFRRIGVLEINDGVFVAIEQALFPRMLGLMGHPAEAEFGLGIEVLPIKAVKKRRGSGAIETAIMETQSDLGHRERVCPTPARVRWQRVAKL